MSVDLKVNLYTVTGYPSARYVQDRSHPANALPVTSRTSTACNSPASACCDPSRSLTQNPVKDIKLL